MPLLSDARFAQGKLVGRFKDAGFTLVETAQLQSLSDEVVSSSKIEGIHLDEVKVRSSVARRLGMETLVEESSGYDVDGAVEVTLDAVMRYDEPLTEERLFGWHNALFPNGYSGPRKIDVARYRTTSMGVASGPVGRERVHFEAPAPEEVPQMMAEFLGWFNEEAAGDHLVKAAIAHLWFVTIHPFSDGNGRIARALTEMQLRRSDDGAPRFYSLASYIVSNREGYYRALERTQKDGPDITRWLAWFLVAVRCEAERSGEEIDRVFSARRSGPPSIQFKSTTDRGRFSPCSSMISRAN